MKAHMIDHAKLVFDELCANVNSTYANDIRRLLLLGDGKFIETIKMPDVRCYDSSDAFAVDYLLYSYLKKYKGLRTGIDKKAAAHSKWQSAEEQCQKTNHVLRTSLWLNHNTEQAISLAQRKIARVLGRFSFDKVLRSTTMGPGATFDLKRRSKPGSKRELPISVTGSALPYAKAYLELDIHWAFSDRDYLPDGPYSLTNDCFNVVRGNRLRFVPKDASVDRPISIEPTFNLFLQKGVGNWIRRRLKLFGVNLDLQSRNQALAQLAQELGYATLDLSSASDTISRLLVALLLPLDWFLYLDDIRSKYTLDTVTGEWVYLEKFSSMGNGFTFELETLIFWSLLPQDDIASVYGDDIICFQSNSSIIIEVLETLGFTINKAKSYVDGRFFESCGKHFFDGVDVTPVFQKEIIYNAASFIRAHNRLFRWSDRSNGQGFDRTSSALDYLFSNYPYCTKPTIPHSSDDRGFLSYHDPTWKFDPNRGYRCRVLKFPKVKIRTKSQALYAWKLNEPGYSLDLDSKNRTRVAGDENKAKLGYAWVKIHIRPFETTKAASVDRSIDKWISFVKPKTWSHNMSPNLALNKLKHSINQSLLAA